MSTNDRSLDFAMSYSELVNQSFEKETYLLRDQADLATRGITAARITAFAGLRNTFINIATDTTMVGYINVAITNRDAAAAPLRTALREILGIAANTFGNKSGEYKTFNSGNIAGMDAADLCTLSVTVAEQAETYLTQMAPKGLTAAMIAELATLKTAVEPTIRAVTKANGDRQLVTSQRHNAANALFNEMKSMCSAAQVYYNDRNAEKADDYIIYDLPTNIQQRNGSINAGQVISRDLSGITAASTINLQVRLVSALQFYFSKTEGGPAGTTLVTVTNNPNGFATHTAAQLGFDKDAGFIFFCIKNPGVDESGEYSVRVEA